FDPEKNAFGPSSPAEQQTETAVRAPRPLNLWEDYVHGPAPHAPGYGEAQMLMTYFEAERVQESRRHDVLVAALDVGNGAAASTNAVPMASALLAYSGGVSGRAFNIGERNTSASLLLAVRAARAAV